MLFENNTKTLTEQVSKDDLAKIDEWKKIIQGKLMPKIIECNTPLEGNIYSLNNHTEYYDYFLSKQRNISLCGINLKQNSEILEIGFNSGFSALLLLLSSHPSVKITCVDINYHPYTIPCFNIIKELFPDRIEILLGSSVDVLPKLTKKYDLIHIDGCHLTEIAEIDIKNSLSLINNNGIMIMDDIDYKDLNIIWNKYVDNYNLIDVDFEIHNCKFHSIKKYIR
jgi:precorrin-6B methylase 2